jgi:hypothetical protein
MRSGVACERAAEETRGDALADVRCYHREAGATAEQAQRVHRSGIPAPSRTEVDSSACRQPSSDVGRRQRAENVAKGSRAHDTCNGARRAGEIHATFDAQAARSDS